MADEQSDTAIILQCFAQFAFDLAAQVRIERGKRLVEQQRFGSRRERPRESHALLLTAGKRRGMAVFKAGKMHRCDLIGDATSAIVLRNGGDSERDILRHGEMRKQRVVLKQQADAAIAAGAIDAAGGIEQHASIENDAAAVGSLEARDRAQRQAFAGA